MTQRHCPVCCLCLAFEEDANEAVAARDDGLDAHAVHGHVNPASRREMARVVAIWRSIGDAVAGLLAEAVRWCVRDNDTHLRGVWSVWRPRGLVQCVCHTLRPVTTALRRVLHRPRLYLIDRVREVQYLRLEGVVRAGRSFVSRGPFEIRINLGKFLCNKSDQTP